MQIGFIGLGSLGTPIAANLVERGHPLCVYNRTASKTAALAAKGALVCGSITELAEQCSVIFSMVSDDAALQSVANDLLPAMQPTAVHVSMSTILPDTAGKLAALHAAKQQHYLAAPVFGRPEAAVARKLNFVMSGQADVKSQVAALLKDAGGVGVFDFGESITAANTVKLCGNFLIASALEAIGESVAMASSSGIDAGAMWQMFGQTIFNAPLYQNYSKIILNKQFEPAAFTATLGLKDMNLVLQQASLAKQPMPLAKLLQQHMQQLVDEGKGQTDWSAVASVSSAM